MKKSDVHTIIEKSTRYFAPNMLNNIKAINVKSAPPHQKVRVLRSAPRFALAFAIIAIIIASTIFTGFMLGEAERIYIEINPSLELVVNHFGLVKEATALNNEALVLMQDYSPKGKNAEKVIEYFVTQAVKEGYLDSEEDTIYIAACRKNGQVKEKKMVRLKEAAKKVLQDKGANAKLIGQGISSKDRQRAKELNIPLGKLSIIEEIISLDPNYTPEQLKDKSMAELRGILRSLQGEESQGRNRQN